jgi:hypothetical protein
MKVALHVGKTNIFSKQPAKESTDMDTKIIEQLEACFCQEFDLAECDLGTLDTAVKQGLEVVGRGLLQRLIDRSDKGYKGSHIPCKCGKVMRFRRHVMYPPSSGRSIRS